MFYLLVVFCLFDCIFGNSFIDVNDILNDDYMPGSLLLLEGASSDSDVDEFVGRNVTKLKDDKSDTSTSGSIMDAFSTMGFHRKMMNEYLCRNFVADQILSDMSLTRIKRRMGTATPVRQKVGNDTPPENRRKDVATVKNHLLTDEGSANYKHWLTKSTTLEDIYRHYENRMQDREIDDHGGDDEDDQDEYEGEVTGYAIQGHNIPQGPNRGTPAKLGYGHSGGGGGGSYGNSGYGSGHSGYGTSGYGHDFSPQHIHYHHGGGGGGGGGGDYEEHGKGEKELALSDLFEIALTAIAFLSFGCYVLQVIMCITSSTTTTTVVTMMPMMMTPMDTGDDGEDDEDDGDSEPVRIRYRRSNDYTINERLNELSRRVLLSIESALIAEEDEGNCLRQQLCENNKYSRTLKDNQKIWVPVWSFGMSYLTGRFISRVPPATAMLDSLKASILGLGNANCKMIYKNCNLRKMRENRRRRRKKRDTEEKSTK